ncbi:MAG TPA: flagellar biosynthesis protein FlgE [Parvularcula sp.]|nr:flagellar biosynthesis protein FlgE [Parvularcula sp.]HBS32819.1 flagellar biosynthesis protein FlgE [Parvularcula sp.]
MGISSSLNAGVAGLAVNAVKLATISDNIANSQTIGYKRADAQFADLVLQQQSGAYSAGGVRAFTFRDAGAQGALITTASSTDISISGRGLLPVTDAAGVASPAADRELLLTSTGSFFTDEFGQLRTQSGLFLLGWPTDSTGSVGSPARDSGSGLEPVRINLNQFSASPTTQVRLGLNLPASDTVAGAPGDPYVLPIEYFDNLGRRQTLSLTFTPTVPATGASNQWAVSIIDLAGSPTTPIGAFDVTFDDTPATGGSVGAVTASGGASYDPATGRVTVTTASGPLEIDIGSPGGGSALTQLSATFAPLAVTKDGAPIGNLSTIEIDEGGVLTAVFDTGFRRPLYQIPVADVPNYRGLNAVGNQAFAVSQDSGDIFLWDAGDGPVGETIGFALSESTTDIAAELTDLIQTQRAYSSNAKIIQTVDEMLQETTNIIR